MQSINPATEEVVARYDVHDESEIERRLTRSLDAFRRWRRVPVSDRSAAMRRVAELLVQDRPTLAALMTREMGKPISQAKAEIDKCAWAARHYAEHAPAELEPRSISSDAATSYVRFDPLGPILAIMPWNFPFWQVFRFAAPSLMAGNVAVLKHAPNVTGTALAIEGLMNRAGLGEGVLTALVVENDTAERLIGHDAIAAVTLTGSVRAGSAVAAAAGRATKKTVLELGGSDPFIVLRDADLEHTVEQAVRARTLNSGQSCIAAKRFLVDNAIAADFVEQMTARLGEARLGNPTSEETDIGPLARSDLRDALHRQVTQSLERGAHCALGGAPLDGRGYYYAPTLLTGVRPGMPAFDEETFGPVAAVTAFETIDEALDLANLSSYGLGASIWTRDRERAESLAARLDAGAVFVNGIVKSDPRLPFGGVKRSGYGRELGVFGLHEFVNVKTVWVA